MQKSKTETLIQKYLSHQLNEQELEELKLWIEEDASHREIFVKLLSLHHVNNQLNLLHQFDKEASWQPRCASGVSSRPPSGSSAKGTPWTKRAPRNRPLQQTLCQGV